MENINIDIDDTTTSDQPAGITSAVDSVNNVVNETKNSTISSQPTTSIDEDDITVADQKAPIILLFGPPSSGKSMTLVRLARYLRKKDYSISPDRIFKHDESYKKRCEDFMNNLNTKEALRGNDLNEFLMIKVSKNGQTICQILEAPGEHYFNPDEPGNTSARGFRPYLTRIMHTLKNRKIWLYLIEAEWRVDQIVKDAYVARIKSCKKLINGNSGDQHILLYNKIDIKEELYSNGKVIQHAAEKAMRDEYPSLAETFKNENPITSLWRPYNYQFVPFSTGDFRTDGIKTSYVESKDHYPARLWETILKCIKG